MAGRSARVFARLRHRGGADGPAIRAEPGVGLDVDGGRIECRGPTPNSASAIVVTQVIAPSAGVRVRGVRITGTCKYGMQAPGNSTPIYSANHIEAQTAAVWHPSATARPIIDANQIFAPAVCTGCAAGFVGINGP